MKTGICTLCTMENPVTVERETSDRVRALCARCREETVHYVRIIGPWPRAVEREHVRNAVLAAGGSADCSAGLRLRRSELDRL